MTVIALDSNLTYAIIVFVSIAIGIVVAVMRYSKTKSEREERDESVDSDGLTPMERALLMQMENEAKQKAEIKKREEEQIRNFSEGGSLPDGSAESPLYPVSNEEVKLILGDNDLGKMIRDLETARADAATLKNQGRGVNLRDSSYGVNQRLEGVRALNSLGGRRAGASFSDEVQNKVNQYYNSRANIFDRKVSNSLEMFYGVYFLYIMKPVLEHFFGEFHHSHEEGALYAKINEVFNIIYGRNISAIFERVNSEDHLSALYQGIQFDQVDVVVSKGMGQHIFSGRAVSYGYSTGIAGKVVVMERGIFEGRSGTEMPGGETEDDYSDLEEDGIFGGFDTDPSVSSFDHAKNLNNKKAREGTVWANDTTEAKLFPNLRYTLAGSQAFRDRFLVYSDDQYAASRLLTPGFTDYLEGLKVPGKICLIFERDRVLLLRNGISGLMEVNLDQQIDPVLEIRKNFYEFRETAKLLDMIRSLT